MERYDAENKYHAWYEHWHRYHWISPWLKNKVVADLACGEGYGSALLAQSADAVIGVDIDRATTEAAKNKYHGLDNLTFQTNDVLNSKIHSDSIDVVVSFETLEHLTEQQKLLDEFKRILKTDGMMVLSTPDKAVYSGSETHNEYHLKELYKAEFKSLVEANFKHVRYFGQQFQTSSLLAPLEDHTAADLNSQSIYIKQNSEFNLSSNQNHPTYLIALASDSLATISAFQQLGTSHFNDVDNSLFKHYEAQVSRLMEADQRLEELESRLKLQSKVISQLQARLGL